MAIDWDAQLLDPNYEALGIAAELDLGTAGQFDITVINSTQGEMVDTGRLHPGLMQAASKPAVCVRVSELTQKGIARTSLKGAGLAFNAASWKIGNTQPKPVPAGAGELILILQDP